MRRSALIACLLAAGCAHPPPVMSRPPPDPLSVVPELDPLLADDPPEMAARLAGEGYERGSERLGGFLPPSAHESLRVAIPARRCAVFAGRASAGMHDLDAALYLPDGTLLAEDEGADAEPLVTYCADEVVPVAYLVLRAFRGAGAYAVSQWSRPVRFGDPVMSPDELHDGSLREISVALARRGFRPDGPVREVHPHESDALIVPLSVQPFSCYTVLASTAEGAVSMRLLDGEAHEVASGAAEPRVSAVQRCAGESAADWSVELRGLGARSVRLWVFSARERDIGGERALWLGEPGASQLAYASAPTAAARHVTLPVSQGQVVERVVAAQTAGRACYVLQASLMAGLSRASVRVEDTGGAQLAEGQILPAGTALRYCAAGPVTAVLTGVQGYGALSLDVALAR
jgi:hypothetical protein